MKKLSKKEVGMIEQIRATHNEMSLLGLEVWDYNFKCGIGFYIKRLDMFKQKFFGSDNLKKHKVDCVYELPNYDEICDKIYEKFKPVFSDYRRYIAHRLLGPSFEESKDKDSVKEGVRLEAYLYYHYEGWIKRYFKEEERRE